MHRANVNHWGPTEVSRGLDSKQLVTDLHDGGLGRDEAVEMLCLVCGVPRGAARLFVASHPAWAAESAASYPDGWMPALRCYGERALPS
jgi:hypothetical protein